ncbi:MAG: leucyl aminopeptidase [Rubrivivax sp.]|nr:leucyl aminopeptidase [Rubrivivax sp.]
MDFKTQVAAATAWGKVECDALLLITVAGAAPAGLDKAVASALEAAAAAGDLEWKAGRTLLLHRVPKVQAPRLACSVAADASPKAFAKAVQAGVQLLKSGGARDLAIALSGAAMTAAHAEAAALAVADAVYVYRHTKPSAPADSPLRSTALLCAQSDLDEAAAGLARGAAIAGGVQLARECANRPPNHCTPSFLAAEMRRIGKSHGLKVDILDRKDCEKLGMGAFLAVAQGSEEPLKFIVARWNGAAKTEAPVVLVGKGITFDSGGISLKPAAEMDEMKFDMGGAASVLGTLRAVAQLKAKVNLVGIIPACENMPSGRAVKPGDVVRSMSGQTIEILNTDAEGRLILCDALTYAERFKPEVVVDIATLTGACVIALGHHRSGLFSNDESLAGELLAAGEAALDPAWRMPLDDEYEEGLKSSFADVANVGGRPGGSITAAKFLQRFAAQQRWAHLDIAGTAWKSGTAKGATGRPVPLLTHFVLARAGRGS